MRDSFFSSPFERLCRLKHRIILIYRVESGLIPFLFLILITDHLNKLRQFLVLSLALQHPSLIHRPKSELQSVQQLPCIHTLFTHLSRLYLASAVDAPTGTRHQLNILIVTALRLQLADNVLDVLKAIS